MTRLARSSPQPFRRRVGTQDPERLHRFDDHYRGAWKSLGDYAEDLLDDMGVTVDSFTPGWLRPYVSIDYLALGTGCVDGIFRVWNGGVLERISKIGRRRRRPDHVRNGGATSSEHH